MAGKPSIYGGRWRLGRSIAAGGQAEIFEAFDSAGEFTQDLVLKRVKNPRRHDRFRTEVEAIRRLDHPNIIKLIDNSALSEDAERPERQFIVMPRAAQGDLQRRVALYRANVDRVLQVTKSLIEALRAAHSAGIIHRDLKPQNILFPGIGHDVWLADFGICLIRDNARATAVDEVVGPFLFIAPELESGGKLDATPAADIDSLGKVMYFMMSGGTVLPRERLHEDHYAQIFEGGERQRMLGTLLARMICPLDRRLPSADDVLGQLERIDRWEREAHLSSMQPATLSRMEALKRSALEVQQQHDVNASSQKRRGQAFVAARDGVLEWFRAKLENAGNEIRDGNAFTAAMRGGVQSDNECLSLNGYRAGEWLELWVRNRFETFEREHILRFSIYTKVAVSTTSRSIDAPNSAVGMPAAEPSHVDLMLVPTYGQFVPGRTPKRTYWQFFSSRGGLSEFGRTVPRRAGNGAAQLHAAEGGDGLMMVSFTTDDWLTASDRFPVIVEKALDMFVTCLDTRLR